MAAENPIHEDDRKLFVGGLPQVQIRARIRLRIELTNIHYRKRRTQTSRSTSGLLEKSRTST